MTRASPVIAAILAAGLALPAASPAAAERMTMSLSEHRVVITSGFTGTNVVLFGVIEADGRSVSRPGGYQMVVTVRGPRRDVTLRRKERVGGVWVNWGSRTFTDVPQYLAILSSRPLDEIATPALRRRLSIGVAANMPPPEPGDEAMGLPQLVELKEENGLFRSDPGGAVFLSRSLFRATIPLPSNVPIGAFEVEARLFAGDTPVAAQTTALEVVKAGFEADVADLAREQPWAYGFGAAFLAILSGWLASVAFRRD